MINNSVRLVVCINERLGTGQRSCVGSGSLGYIATIRELLAANQMDVNIVQRECLGKCEQGPVMRIAPGGRFFTDIDDNSLPLIVEELKRFIESKAE